MHLDGAELGLLGRARDLITDTTPTVTSEASVDARLDAKATLTHLSVEPASGDVESLIGRVVGGGFRQAVGEAVPAEVASGTPAALLLDDLPVAALISGYARLYAGTVPKVTADTTLQTDICSGWRTDGTMMVSVRAGTGVPVTVGPTAPSIDLDREIDELGWHSMDQLRPGSMRRRRLVDVTVDEGDLFIAALFRDTYRKDDGHETVLHEYSLTAVVDGDSGTYQSCAAVPRVLPWVECPVAASSADRLVGQHIDAVRNFVRRELRGTSTCTHLNDLLRSLGDVGTLASSLATTLDHRKDQRP